MYESKSKSNCTGCGLRRCNVDYCRLPYLKVRSNQNKKVNRTQHDRQVPCIQLPTLQLLTILWLLYFLLRVLGCHWKSCWRPIWQLKRRLLEPLAVTMYAEIMLSSIEHTETSNSDLVWWWTMKCEKYEMQFKSIDLW